MPLQSVSWSSAFAAIATLHKRTRKKQTSESVGVVFRRVGSGESVGVVFRRVESGKCVGVVFRRVGSGESVGVVFRRVGSGDCSSSVLKAKYSPYALCMCVCCLLDV